MKNIKQYFVLCVLLNLSSILYGQQKESLNINKSIFIAGKILGETSLVKKIDINIIHSDTINYEFKSIKPDVTGSFEFTFEGKSRLSKITQVVIYYESGHDILNNYVVEPNDSVFLEINISKDSILTDINFSGRGSTKYKCRREIEIIHGTWDNARGKIPLVVNSDYYDVVNMNRM